MTAQFYRVGVAADRAVGNLYHSGIIAANALSGRSWDGIEGHAWEFANIWGDPKRSNMFYVFHGAFGRRRFPGTGTNDFIGNFGNFHPTALAVDARPTSETLLVGADGPNRIMRTLNGNVDAPAWSAVTIDTGGTPLAQPFTALDFCPSQPASAYGITGDGRVFFQANVNGSGAWTQTGSWAMSGVRGLAVNPSHVDRIYAITGGAVARSADSGATWTAIPGTGANALPSSEVNSIVAYPSHAQTLFVALDIGVFITRNEGATWHPFDVGLPNAEVLSVFWKDGWLYAVTHGRGLWRRSPCL